MTCFVSHTSVDCGNAYELSEFWRELLAYEMDADDPNEPGHVGRLHAVLDDCSPSAVLTTTAAAEGVRKFFRTRPANQRPRVIAVDANPDFGTLASRIPSQTRSTIRDLLRVPDEDTRRLIQACWRMARAQGSMGAREHELVLLWGEDITPTLEQLAQEGAVARDLSP